MVVSSGIQKVLILFVHLSFRTVIGFIVKAPHDTEALVGQPTYFNCSTSFLNDSKEIAWYHFPIDSIDLYVYSRGLFNNYGDRFRVNNDPSTGTIDLIILSVEERDAGEYVCEDEGGLGRHSTRKAQLIVLVGNPICRSNMSSDGVVGPTDCGIESEYFELSCGIPFHGNVPPIMEWTKAGSNSTITAGVTYEKSFNTSAYKLTMKGDLNLDGSTYVCQTTRSATKQYNCTSDQVKILYALRSADDNKGARIATVGEKLVCSVNSSQNCRHKWKWMNDKGFLIESDDRTWTAELGRSQRCEVECNIHHRLCLIVENVLVTAIASDAPMLTFESSSAPTVSYDVYIVLGSITFAVFLIAIFIVVFIKRKWSTNLSDESQYLLTNVKASMERKIETHRKTLEYRIIVDFGLLDELSGSLSVEDINMIETLKLGNRLKQLLNCILENNKGQEFVNALRVTGQTHLANYLEANGVYNLEKFDGDWPVDDRKIKMLNSNSESLVDLLVTENYLCDLLETKEIINKRQKEFIFSKSTIYDKNKALFYFLNCTSERVYQRTIVSLHESDQSNVAKILSEGGAVVNIHVNLDDDSGDADQNEEDVITKLADLIKAKPRSEEELASVLVRILGERSSEEIDCIWKLFQLNLIAAKCGGSVCLYFHCILLKDLYRVHEQFIQGQLTCCVQMVLTILLSRKEKIQVSMNFSEVEYRRLRDFCFEQPVDHQQLEKHRRFLVDQIDPDLGLLDHIVSNLTSSKDDEFQTIKQEKTIEHRNAKLLGYVLVNNKMEDFKAALKATGQIHLVNYLEADGVLERSREYGDDWPLGERETSLLRINHERLIENLDPCHKLLFCVDSKKVFNKRQMESIHCKSTDHEKSRVFLDMLERGSLRQYKTTIDCLKESKQEHVGKYFSSRQCEDDIPPAAPTGQLVVLKLQDRIQKHKAWIAERMDPDFGLLDKLYKKSTLTKRELHDIETEATVGHRNYKLIDCILTNRKTEELMVALNEAKQMHLVNYLKADGEYDPEFGDVWPLGEKEINMMQTNHEQLINCIVLGEGEDLLSCLYSEDIINNRQKEFILVNNNVTALLEILQRLSLKQFMATIRCLQLTNRSNVAEFLGLSAKREGWMNDEIRNHIIDIYDHFIKRVDADELINHLIQANVLSPKEWDEIETEGSTRLERCRTLLNNLFMKKHPKAFVVLRQSLVYISHMILDIIDRPKYESSISQQQGASKNEDIRNRIVDVFAQFVENVDADLLIDYLIQGNVMRLKDFDEIKTRESNKVQRCQALLNILFTKDPLNAFVVIRRALVSETHYIVEVLDSIANV